MKCLLVSCVLLALVPLTAARADLPYTFEAGAPIRASELNANFQYLESLGSGGEFGTLTRRRATLSASSFRDVVTVPSSSASGWVLRNYVTNCGALRVRIDNDPDVPLAAGESLLVQPGETLQARCSTSPGVTPIGYFMFNEQ